MQRIARTEPGTLYADQVIPKSGGGFWPHKVDIYRPIRAPLRAIVCLHGAGGNKANFARALRVLFTTPPTVDSANWALMDSGRALCVFVQGQACTTANATSNAWNPNGVNTVSASYPTGVATWSNGHMWSGSDDKSFLQDLRTYILGTFGSVLACHLVGHSNGGMMVKRMLRESPIYSHHATISGPTPGVYDSVAFAPSTPRPLWCQVGRLDDVLGIKGGNAGPGDHLSDALWNQQLAQISIANVKGSSASGTWVPALAQYVGETVELQRAMNAYNTANSLPAQTFSLTDGVTRGIGNGQYITLTYGGGKIVMRSVEHAGHGVIDQEQTRNELLLREIVDWIAS